MDDEFGPAYARTLARDLVMSSLGERTVVEALAAKEDTRTVWLAICDAMDVPEQRRWGQDDRRASARRR